MTKSKMIGSGDYDLFPSDQADILTTNDRQVLNSGCKVGRDETIQTPRGLRTMSHEIRTPMNGMLGMLGMLELEGFSLGLAYPAAIPTAAKVPGVFTDMRFPVALADTEDLQRLLELARAANLRCCAQGVEHIAHWQTLTKSGCESASGPLIAPAMHLDQAMEWALHKTRGMRKAEAHGKPAGRSAS